MGGEREKRAVEALNHQRLKGVEEKKRVFFFVVGTLERRKFGKRRSPNTLKKIPEEEEKKKKAKQGLIDQKCADPTTRCSVSHDTQQAAFPALLGTPTEHSSSISLFLLSQQFLQHAHIIF